MKKQQKYKNYTVLLFLVALIGIMFGLTIVKMTKHHNSTKNNEIIRQ